MKLGLPTVAVITERFRAVALSTARSQRIPQSILIEIAGNPEFVAPEALERIAVEIAKEAAHKLTTAAPSGDEAAPPEKP